MKPNKLLLLIPLFAMVACGTQEGPASSSTSEATSQQSATSESQQPSSVTSSASDSKTSESTSASTSDASSASSSEVSSSSSSSSSEVSSSSSSSSAESSSSSSSSSEASSSSGSSSAESSSSSSSSSEASSSSGSSTSGESSSSSSATTSGDTSSTSTSSSSEEPPTDYYREFGMLHGEGKPDADTGEDGEVYVNTSDFSTYYKDNGVWYPSNMKGDALFYTPREGATNVEADAWLYAAIARTTLNTNMTSHNVMRYGITSTSTEAEKENAPVTVYDYTFDRELSHMIVFGTKETYQQKKPIFDAYLKRDLNSDKVYVFDNKQGWIDVTFQGYGFCFDEIYGATVPTAGLANLLIGKNYTVNDNKYVFTSIEPTNIPMDPVDTPYTEFNMDVEITLDAQKQYISNALIYLSGSGTYQEQPVDFVTDIEITFSGVGEQDISIPDKNLKDGLYIAFQKDGYALHDENLFVKGENDKLTLTKYLERGDTFSLIEKKNDTVICYPYEDGEEIKGQYDFEYGIGKGKNALAQKALIIANNNESEVALAADVEVLVPSEYEFVIDEEDGTLISYLDTCSFDLVVNDATLPIEQYYYYYNVRDAFVYEFLIPGRFPAGTEFKFNWDAEEPLDLSIVWGAQNCEVLEDGKTVRIIESYGDHELITLAAQLYFYEDKIVASSNLWGCDLGFEINGENVEDVYNSFYYDNGINTQKISEDLSINVDTWESAGKHSFYLHRGDNVRLLDLYDSGGITIYRWDPINLRYVLVEGDTYVHPNELLEGLYFFNVFYQYDENWENVTNLNVVIHPWSFFGYRLTDKSVNPDWTQLGLYSVEVVSQENPSDIGVFRIQVNEGEKLSFVYNYGDCDFSIYKRGQNNALEYIGKSIDITAENDGLYTVRLTGDWKAIIERIDNTDEKQTIQASLGAWTNDGAKIYAWAWTDGFDGDWYAFDGTDNTFEIPEICDHIILMRFANNVSEPRWDAGVWNRSDELAIQEGVLTFNGWGNPYSQFSWVTE